jgi:hypothetical protein
MTDIAVLQQKFTSWTQGVRDRIHNALPEKDVEFA